MRKALSAIFFLSVVLASYATDFSEDRKRWEWLLGAPDTTYIESIANTLGLKVFYSNKFSSFDINSPNFKDNLMYKANSNNSVGLGFIYSFLDVNFGYSHNKSKNGDSKKIDFQTQMYLPTSTWTIYINKYKGFYLSNPEKWIEDWSNGDSYTRDDIEAKSIRATMDYFFNHKHYSNKVLFAHQALQKKTAGSLVAGMVFCYNGVRGDSTLIPEKVVDSLNFNLDVTSTDYYSLGANVGYALNVSIRKNWFISGMLSPGVSFARNTQSSGEGSMTENTLNLYLQSEFGLGYNCRNFYIGAYRKQYLSRSSIGHEHESLDLRNGKTYVMFVYRIPVKSFSIF